MAVRQQDRGLEVEAVAMRWLTMAAWFTLAACARPGGLTQLPSGLTPLPRRFVPDTRKVQVVEWSVEALDTVRLLMVRTLLEHREQGGCAIGGLSNDSTIVIDKVVSADSVWLQEEDRVAFTCARVRGYLGTVHTHPDGAYPLPSLLDHHTFQTDENAGLLVVASPAGLAVVNREFGTGFRKIYGVH